MAPRPHKELGAWRDKARHHAHQSHCPRCFSLSEERSPVICLMSPSKKWVVCPDCCLLPSVFGFHGRITTCLGLCFWSCLGSLSFLNLQVSPGCGFPVRFCPTSFCTQLSVLPKPEVSMWPLGPLSRRWPVYWRSGLVHLQQWLHFPWLTPCTPSLCGGFLMGTLTRLHAAIPQVCCHRSRTDAGQPGLNKVCTLVWKNKPRPPLS